MLGPVVVVVESIQLYVKLYFKCMHKFKNQASHIVQTLSTTTTTGPRICPTSDEYSKIIYILFLYNILFCIVEK